MWQDFIRQLSSTKSKDSNQSQFQACKVAIPFTWGLSTNQPYTLEYWNFCNQLLHWSNTNVYFPATGSFVSSYESWLNLLTQKTGLGTDYLSQVQMAQKKLDYHASDLTNQYSTYRESATRMKSVPKTFSEWESSNNQGKLVQLKNDIDTLVQKPPLISSSPMTDYVQVWAAFNNSSNFRFYVDSGFQVYNRRIYDWTESPITIGAYIGSRKKVKAPISIGLTRQIANSTGSKLPFFRSMDGKDIFPEEKSAALSPSQFSGELKFEDTLVIDVSPNSKWFIESFLTNNKSGPYNNPNVVGFGSQASAGQTYFFGGDKAILPSYITSLTIGFNPSFSISGDRQNLSFVNKAINETGGIHLGPIPFRNENGIDQIDMSNLSNNMISSNNIANSTPVIIGVNIRFFNEDN